MILLGHHSQIMSPFNFVRAVCLCILLIVSRDVVVSTTLYAVVPSNSGEFITVSTTIQDRRVRHYRLESEKTVPASAFTMDLPHSEVYQLGSPKPTEKINIRKNFLYVADKRYYVEKNIKFVQDINEIDVHMTTWQTTTLGQIEEFCEDYTSETTYSTRQSLSAIELLRLQLECLNELYKEVNPNLTPNAELIGASVETLSKLLNAQQSPSSSIHAPIFGHVHLESYLSNDYGKYAEKVHPYRSEEKCTSGCVPWKFDQYIVKTPCEWASKPTISVPKYPTFSKMDDDNNQYYKFDNNGEIFDRNRETEIYPCTDEEGRLPVWYMWTTGNQELAFAGKCYCGGDTNKKCSAFQFCHAWRDEDGKTTKAECNYKPSCGNKDGDKNVAQTVFGANVLGPSCGLVLSGLHGDGEDLESATKIRNVQDINYKLRRMLAEHYAGNTLDLDYTSTPNRKDKSLYPLGREYLDEADVHPTIPFFIYRHTLRGPQNTNQGATDEEKLLADLKDITKLLGQQTRTFWGSYLLEDARMNGVMDDFDTFVNETGGVYDECFCSNKNISKSCPIDESKQYCVASATAPHAECRNEAFEDMLIMPRSTALENDTTINSYKATGVRKKCRWGTSFAELCSEGEICDLRLGCSAVLPDCPVGQFTDTTYPSYTKCLCEQAECDKHQGYCHAGRCYPYPMCPSFLGKNVSSAMCSCAGISSCGSGTACAAFNWDLSAIGGNFSANVSTDASSLETSNDGEEAHACFNEVLTTCERVDGMVAAPKACYCGAQSSQNPICLTGFYCSKSGGQYSCLAKQKCETEGTSMAINQTECMCGDVVCSKNSLLNNTSLYCYLHADGEYKCGGEGGAVNRIQSKAENLKVARLFARAKVDTVTLDIVRGCRDQTSCDYDATATYQPTNGDGACNHYPDIGKDCNGNCIIKAQGAWNETEKGCVNNYPPEQAHLRRKNDEGVFFDIVDNAYPGRLFEVYDDITGVMKEVPITGVATKYYGCPIGTLGACNALFEASTDWPDQNWHKHLCIYPPEGATCSTGTAETFNAETFNNNFHDFQIQVQDLYKCNDESLCDKHASFDCWQEKCGYHPDPDQLTQGCSGEPVTTQINGIANGLVCNNTQGRRCKDDSANNDTFPYAGCYILGQKTERLNAMTAVTCPDNYNVTKTTLEKLTCTYTPPETATQLADHYHYYDGEFDDNRADIVGKRRLAAQNEEEEFLLGSVTTCDTNNKTTCWRQPAAPSLTKPIIVSSAGNRTSKVVSQAPTFPLKQYTESNYDLSQDLRLGSFNVPTMEEIEAIPGLMTKANELWQERGKGNPSPTYFQDPALYGDDFYHGVPQDHYKVSEGYMKYDSGKSSSRLRWMGQDTSLVGRLSRHSNTFWKRVFAKESNTKAVEEKAIKANKNAHALPTYKQQFDQRKQGIKYPQINTFNPQLNGQLSAIHQNLATGTSGLDRVAHVLNYNFCCWQGAWYDKSNCGKYVEKWILVDYFSVWEENLGGCKEWCENVQDFVQWEKAKGYSSKHNAKITQTGSYCEQDVWGAGSQSESSMPFVYFEDSYAKDNMLHSSLMTNEWCKNEDDFIEALKKEPRRKGGAGAFRAEPTDKSPSAPKNWPEEYLRHWQGKTGRVGDRIKWGIEQDWYDGPDKCNQFCLNRNYPTSYWRVNLYDIDWDEVKYQIRRTGDINSVYVWEKPNFDPWDRPNKGSCWCYTTGASRNFKEYYQAHWDIGGNANDGGHRLDIHECDRKRTSVYDEETPGLANWFDVTYTFSCEAGKYYDGAGKIGSTEGVGFHCASCPAGKFSLENFPFAYTHYSFDDSAYSKLNGPPCEECPIGSQAVTMSADGYRVYKFGDADIGNSHASMCKKCPEGWTDMREFGFDAARGCKNIPKPRSKQYNFAKKWAPGDKWQYYTENWQSFQYDGEMYMFEPEIAIIQESQVVTDDILASAHNDSWDELRENNKHLCDNWFEFGYDKTEKSYSAITITDTNTVPEGYGVAPPISTDHKPVYTIKTHPRESNNICDTYWEKKMTDIKVQPIFYGELARNNPAEVTTDWSASGTYTPHGERYGLPENYDFFLCPYGFEPDLAYYHDVPQNISIYKGEKHHEGIFYREGWGSNHNRRGQWRTYEYSKPTTTGRDGVEGLSYTSSPFGNKVPLWTKDEDFWTLQEGDDWEDVDYTSCSWRGGQGVTTREDCLENRRWRQIRVSRCIPCNRGSMYHPEVSANGYPMCTTCPVGKHNPKHKLDHSFGRKDNITNLGAPKFVGFKHRFIVTDNAESHCKRVARDRPYVVKNEGQIQICEIEASAIISNYKMLNQNYDECSKYWANTVGVGQEYITRCSKKLDVPMSIFENLDKESTDVCEWLPATTDAVWNLEALTSYAYSATEQIGDDENAKLAAPYEWRSTGPLQKCPMGTDITSNEFKNTVTLNDDDTYTVTNSTATNPYYDKTSPSGGNFNQVVGSAPWLPQKCYACPKGKYKDGTLDKCTFCPVGQFSDGEGWRVCKNCPSGFFNNNFDIELPWGTRISLKTGSSLRIKCQACEPRVNRQPAENFRPFNGLNNCWSCESGRYITDAGADEILGGLKGYTETTTGDSSKLFCRECQPGQYNEDFGKTECTQCPAGKAEYITLVPKRDAFYDDSLTAVSARFASLNPSSTAFDSSLVGKLLKATNVSINHETWSFSAINLQDAKSVLKSGTDGTVYDSASLLTTKWIPDVDTVTSNWLETAVQWVKYTNPVKKYEFNNTFIKANKDKWVNPRSINQCAACPPGYYQDEPGHSWGIVSYQEPQRRTFKRETTIEFTGTHSYEPSTLRVLISDYPKDTHLTEEKFHATLLGCKKCAAGMYQDEVGNATGCKLCPQGWSTGDYETQYECTVCKKGMYSNYNDGVDVCKTCPKGWGVSDPGAEGSTSCSPCARGRFGKDGYCKDCDPGKFQGSVQQGECKLCMRGRYSEISNSSGTLIEGRTGAFCNNACESGYTTLYRGSTRFSQCTAPCPIGRYSDGFGCVFCPAGKFNSFIAQSQCEDCLKGTYQVKEGGLICTTCNRGKSSDTTGLTSQDDCTDCAAGKIKGALKWVGFKDPEAYTCRNVSRGLHMPYTGKTVGVICPAGTYSDVPGLSVCKTCEKGKYQEPKFKGRQKKITEKCFDCPAGRYGDEFGITAMLKCKPCDEGKYSTFEGSPREECTVCARGLYNGIKAQKDCEVCEEGKYQDQEEQPICKNCPVGTFSDKLAAYTSEHCKSCPAGFTTDAEGGAVSCSKCEKGYGYNPNNNLCELCNSSLGQWNDEESNSERGGICRTIICPSGQGFSSTKASSFKAATNWDGSTSRFCENCPTGKYKNGALNTNEGSEDICQDARVSYPPTMQEKEDLKFGQYYSFSPWEDVKIQTASMCGECGTSFCFQKRNADGGEMTCKSLNGIPDFTDELNYFGEGASRCEHIDRSIESETLVVASNSTNDFCSEYQIGCGDPSACNFCSYATVQEDDTCEFSVKNGHCTAELDSSEFAEQRCAFKNVTHTCNPGFEKTENNGIVQCVVDIASLGVASITEDQIKSHMKTTANAYSQDTSLSSDDKLNKLRNYMVENLRVLKQLKKQKNENTEAWLHADMYKLRHKFFVTMENSHGERFQEMKTAGRVAGGENATEIILFGPDNKPDGDEEKQENCKAFMTNFQHDDSCITFDLSQETTQYAYKYMLGCEVGCWNVFGFTSERPRIRQIGVAKNKYSMACWNQRTYDWENEVVLYKDDTYTCGETNFLIGSALPLSAAGCKEDLSGTGDYVNRQLLHYVSVDPSAENNDGCAYSGEYRDQFNKCTSNEKAPHETEQNDGSFVCEAKNDGHYMCNNICDEFEKQGCMIKLYEDGTERCDYDSAATYMESANDCKSKLEYLSQFTIKDLPKRVDLLNCLGSCKKDTNTDGRKQGDGVCDSEEVEGCMRADACNFNENATYTHTTKCYFAGIDNSHHDHSNLLYKDCEGQCINDDLKSDNGVIQQGKDGICDELQKSCHDEIACTYNQAELTQKFIHDASLCKYATDEDTGQELNRTVYMCWFNGTKYPHGYCQQNDIDGDGVCPENEIKGCRDNRTDPPRDICNYDTDPTTDHDPSLCTYAPEEYRKCDGTCKQEAFQNNDGITRYEGSPPLEYTDWCVEDVVLGCMDQDACNYKTYHTHDDPENPCEYAGQGRYEYRNCSGVCNSDTRMPNNRYCDEEEIAACTAPTSENRNRGIEACNIVTGSQYYHDESNCTYSTTNRTCNNKLQLVLAAPFDGGDFCTTDGTGLVVRLVWLSTVDKLYKSNTQICNGSQTQIAENINIMPDPVRTSQNKGAHTLNYGDMNNYVTMNTVAAEKGTSHWITDCDEATNVDFKITCTGTIGCTDSNACTYNSEAHTHDQGLCEYLDLCDNCGGDNSGCDESYYTGCHNASACNTNTSKQVDDESYCVFPTVRKCATENGELTGELNMNFGGCHLDTDRDNRQPNDNVCDEEEKDGCMNSNACNHDSSASFQSDDSLCIMPYTSDEYKNRECNRACRFDTDADGRTPGDDVCDEDETDGCMNLTACNYNLNASFQSKESLCNMPDCKKNANYSGCEGSNTGPYSLYWETTFMGDCCAYRDCFGVCDGPAERDCNLLCGGTASETYTLDGGQTITGGGCCIESDRDCENNCPSEDHDFKVRDALGVCGGPCANDDDSDKICDDEDPCVGTIDCGGVCNGNNSYRFNNETMTDCCEPGERDCTGKCNGAAERLDSTVPGDKLGVCCDGTKTKLNKCCSNTQVDDNDGECCSNTELGCDNVCGSNKRNDTCGVCGGTGIPKDKCDCYGNTHDVVGDCGGNCTKDEDEDKVCDVVDPCVGTIDCGNDCIPVRGDAKEKDVDGACCLSGEKDCAGKCNGGAKKDCAGKCNGGAFWDCDQTCITELEQLNGNLGEPDTDNDTVCDKDEVEDCFDETACNYNEDATDTNNTLCFYEDQENDADTRDESREDYDAALRQPDLRGYQCPEGTSRLEADATCIDKNPKNDWCDNNEKIGCNSHINSTACKEGGVVRFNDAKYDASATVTWHQTKFCVYPETGKNCNGECSDGDKDNDGICDIDDACATNNPCLNEATCTDIWVAKKNAKKNDVQCNCATGYTGDLCGDQKVCGLGDKDCSGNGVVNTNSFVLEGCSCDCNDGWTGDDCSLNINECDPNGDGTDNPCAYGNCTEGSEPAEFSCVCYDGYEKEADEEACTVCPAGSGWNGLDGSDAKCLACVYPKTQDKTAGSDKCISQYCNGGRENKEESDGFLKTLDPALDNDNNCKDCPSHQASPPGPNIPCQDMVCPNLQKLKLNGRDQTYAHDDVRNCVSQSCGDIEFFCQQGKIRDGADAVKDNCGCDCVDDSNNPTGYTGEKCNIQINECTETGDLQHQCQRGVCHDKEGQVKGYYHCNCTDTGYTGTYCENQIDECTETGDLQHQCHADATCTDGLSGFTEENDYRGYTCACPAGYDGNGYKTSVAGGTGCENRNECSINNGDCDPNSVCEDFTPAENNNYKRYSCTCKNGFDGNGKTMSDLVCTNINECDTEEHNCHTNADCGDTVGSFTCTCKSGYEGTDATASCTDINECTTENWRFEHKCIGEAECANKPGSYNCICPDGYTGDGMPFFPDGGNGCTDINHCDTEGCPAGETCFNILGATGPHCETTQCTTDDFDCVHGSVTGDVTLPPSNDVVYNHQSQIVRDTFSCECDCQTIGGIPNGRSQGFTRRASDKTCTVCPAGSGMNADGNCEACNETSVNALATYAAACAEHSCQAGYGYTSGAWDKTSDSTTSGNCVECEGATVSPSGQGQCAEVQCNEGYEPKDVIDHTLQPGHQDNCKDKNECATDNGGCHAKATCANTPGGHNCTCKEPWYEGSGTECDHKDLCALNPCNTAYQTCIQTDEVGRECADINECTTDPNRCGANTQCIERNYEEDGVGYTCACKSGFTDNGGLTNGDGCVNVNECEGDNDCVTGLNTCSDGIGNYTCACPEGYDGNGYKTSVAGGTGCENRNECDPDGDGDDSDNPCDSNAFCKNLDPASNGAPYSCTCKSGYNPNGKNMSLLECSVIDYCTSNPCQDDQTCFSIFATGPHCETTKCTAAELNCVHGQVGNVGFSIMPQNGWTSADQILRDASSCECDCQTDGGDPGGKSDGFTQRASDKTCTVCPAGMGRTGEAGAYKCEACNDTSVNALDTYAAACAKHSCEAGYGYTSDWNSALDSKTSDNCAACEDATVSPSGQGQCAAVECLSGYEPIANADINHTLQPGHQDNCKDTNECATDNGGCHANATCANTPGGHNCTCNATWYVGDGYTCNHKDLCSSDLNPCNTTYETCSYETEQNAVCADIDECDPSVNPVNPCGANAQCIEKEYAKDGEGYTCTCDKGYKMVGDSCEDINHCDTDRCPAGETCGCPEGETCFNILGATEAVCRDPQCTTSDLDCKHGSVTGDVDFSTAPQGGWTSADDIDRLASSCGCVCQEDGGVPGGNSDGFTYRASDRTCTLCPAGSGRTGEAGAYKCEVCADEYVNALDTYAAACAKHSCQAGYGYTSDWNSALTSTTSENCVECEGATVSPSGQGQCAAVQCNLGYKPKADIDHTREQGDQYNCKDIEECDNEPCDADTETCDEKQGRNATHPLGYVCECASGYYRDSNSICVESAACADNSCSGHGQCTVVSQNNISCHCATGYYGPHCETNPYDCPAVGACANGVCHDGLDTFNCTCNTHYEPATNGKSCERKSYCGGVTCNNRGTCENTSPGNYQCRCQTGYEGKDCETNKNDCAGKNCNSRGTCQDLVDDYTCNCTMGYEGKDCQTDPNDCPSTTIDIWVSEGDRFALGTVASPYYRFYTDAGCSSEMANPQSLQAHTNYTFRRCNGATSHRFGIQNDLVWSADLVGSGTLTLNVENVDTNFAWKCFDHSWMSGTFTAVDAGVCQHGTCVDEVNGYRCNCADTGYKDTYCQTSVNDCESHLCHTNGECVDEHKGYRCECHNDFTGPFCQIAPNYCSQAGNVACSQGVCIEDSSKQAGYKCECHGGFDRDEYGHCTVCGAGKGWNGKPGDQSRCLPCADGQANAQTSHSAPCAVQRCLPGYGVVEDSDIFRKDQDHSDFDNAHNCEPCTGGKVSPGLNGVCKQIECPLHYNIKNPYNNQLAYNDEDNCECVDSDDNDVCDFEETGVCGDTAACEHVALSENMVHKTEECYYADNDNIKNGLSLKNAHCNGTCFHGFTRTGALPCRVNVADKANSVSIVRNNAGDNKQILHDGFVAVFKDIVQQAHEEEPSKPQRQTRYESRIPIKLSDLPGDILPSSKTKIQNILDAKGEGGKLTMVVAPCEGVIENCGGNPTATDDTCVTSNLNDDVNSSDLTRYVLERAGCWQVFGTDAGPIAKQTKTETGYHWQCWNSGSWSDTQNSPVGDTYECPGFGGRRAFLTGSSTDITIYGCTEQNTETENCNYNPQAAVNDGSCVHADELYQPGYNCTGGISNANRVCEVSGCTDNELVAAYQARVSSCNADGQHAMRAGQCSTHGCDAAQLEAAFDALQTGQCPLLEEEEEETAETPTTAAPVAVTCSDFTTPGECCAANGCGMKSTLNYHSATAQCEDVENLNPCTKELMDTSSTSGELTCNFCPYDITCAVSDLFYQQGSCGNNHIHQWQSTPFGCHNWATQLAAFNFFAYDTSTSTCTYWQTCTGNKNDGVTVMNVECPGGR